MQEESDKMTEQFANFAVSNLASAISASQTKINVINASSFPLQGTFRIVVQSFDVTTQIPTSAPEIMLVTAVNSTQFTVVRGYESTQPIAFAAGAQVVNVVTAGVMEELLAGSGGSSALVVKVTSFPYTMSAQSGLTVYTIYAAGAAVTIKWPTTPASNQIARFVDAGNTSGTNPITISGNGTNIVAYGSSTNSSIELAQNGSEVTLAWDGSNLV